VARYASQREGRDGRRDDGTSVDQLRSVLGRLVPAAARAVGIQHPGPASSATRGHRDRVDKVGKITLRHGGRLYPIGIRVVDAATGELLRELILDPSKRYQGTGRPPGPRR
jgi:hypothetical protein